MLYIGITSIHLCGKKDENMGNRFSIEELTCLHLLRCHYADICSKEERELRETIALHPATFVIWGIERSGFFNGREKWAKGFENQRV